MNFEDRNRFSSSTSTPNNSQGNYFNNNTFQRPIDTNPMTSVSSEDKPYQPNPNQDFNLNTNTVQTPQPANWQNPNNLYTAADSNSTFQELLLTNYSISERRKKIPIQLN